MRREAVQVVERALDDGSVRWLARQRTGGECGKGAAHGRFKGDTLCGGAEQGAYPAEGISLSALFAAALENRRVPTGVSGEEGTQQSGLADSGRTGHDRRACTAGMGVAGGAVELSHDIGSADQGAA
ncbi:hypothetical protein GCM10010341_66060 [Streptomyces noursei]|nr:hypothetical protein GCM10010341_66060 [Streptomyces noursei]